MTICSLSSTLKLWLSSWLVAVPLSAAAPLKEYRNELAPETPVERGRRHFLVAERRSQPIIMVHRGATAFAPENSLRAYASAMDFGANGCEVDLRRTRDGVLVLFHDDTLEHLTDGFGPVYQLTYQQLAGLHSETAFGRPLWGVPPTFPALLNLVRERAMLLHLDVKEPGLEEDIGRWLQAADVWDHIVSINSANASNLLRNPNLHLLRYKTSGLYEGRRDMDPDTVKAALAQPGEMLLVDDPRVAVRVLKRPPLVPKPLIEEYRLILRSEPAPEWAVTNTFMPMAYLEALARRTNSKSTKTLLSLMEPRAIAELRSEPDATSQRSQHTRILERAWAAQQTGVNGRKSAPVVKALESFVRQRALDRDWAYHGLDGSMAVRALGKLGATEAVPTLTAMFQEVDPALARIAREPPASVPIAWLDYSIKQAVFPALAELRCAAAKQFLLSYVSLDEPAARALSPPMFEDATKALMAQRLTWTDVAALLRSPNLAVRGAAILECLDHPTDERLRALRVAAPWALELPRGAFYPFQQKPPAPPPTHPAELLVPRRHR